MAEEETSKTFERPLECGECKRPIKVLYTEIVGKTVTRTAMCEECPVLRNKLHGQSIPTKQPQEGPAALCCGGCGLTLDEVRMGSELGCPLCYEIFAEEIFHELSQIERLPPKYLGQKRPGILHAGRSPGEHQAIDPSLKLLTLQQALHDTLRREDYEQAAWLRDQIKALEDQSRKEQTDDK
jgi:protein arginine kinase activator